MPFKVTITESKEVTRKVGKEWKVVGQKKESSPAGEFTADVWDYTPEIEKTVIEETKVLEQTVETIDLPAVIKAINKL